MMKFGQDRAGYRKARMQRRAFYRSSWWLLLLAGIVATVIAVPLWTLGRPPLREFALGAYVATCVLFAVFTAGAVTGSWNRWMGGLAEDWTGDSLKRFKRQGYRLYQSVPAEWYDIDHVIVGRGGVIALETKWSAQSFGQNWRQQPELQHWLTVTRIRSRRIRVVTKQPIIAVLVVWGPVRKDLPDGLTQIDDVWVMNPPRGRLTLEPLLTGSYSAGEIHEITRTLDEYVATVVPLADRSV